MEAADDHTATLLVPAASSGTPREEQPTTCHTRVVVRFRPLSARERRICCTEVQLPYTVNYRGSDSISPLSFTFDRVFEDSCSQGEVFDDVRSVVRSVLAGGNGTVMAYGQTGSGKTHTLIGDVSCEQGKGVVPRAVRELADCIAKDTEGNTYKITLSVVEIYCERIRDLLAPPGSNADNLAVLKNKARGVFVAGATEIPVHTEDELVMHMQNGIGNRTVAFTGMNAESSRSHCVMHLLVEKHCPDGSQVHGKLCLVDLAGSERVDRTGCEGLAFEEGKTINKSLSALGNVVNALTQGDGGVNRSSHIPYRDSKLTRVLQDSLGGNAKTVLIICCSASSDNGPETLSSLRFGSRAKGIVNTLEVCSTNKASSDAAFLLLAARKECEDLKEEIKKLLEGKTAEKTDSAINGPEDTAILETSTEVEAVTGDKATTVSGKYWILAHVIWQLVCVACWLLITS